MLHTVWFTLLALSTAFALTACAESRSPATAGPSVPETRKTSEFLKDADIIQLSNATAFVLPATAGPASSGGLKRWVWYAPTFIDGTTPMAAQHAYYVDALRSSGIAVVGVDVGESYGSPAGRAAFAEFWAWLQVHGYSKSGGWILQSRGGLQGYTFLLEHPDAATAVAGIYPLLTYDDYIGPAGMHSAWNLTLDQFNAAKGLSDPLAHAAAFTFPILHVHGDADITTTYAREVEFMQRAPNSELITVPGLAHEYYNLEFFGEPRLINFLKEHLQ